ncbi:hypothetical protein M408DRAFT_299165 [Serendipita vermifera MAFF 305830]|uniref:VHS domain-containing protein n=1 Tax=Serendipita vermifera MAFF 305830 TaxID=933852 RepID=A0A0C3APB7_SERVB|nr:hypothetical protein M408DRAFT_299165 [Serendipita vermifera MAFF 305830]
MDDTVQYASQISSLYTSMAKKVNAEGHEGAISAVATIRDRYLNADKNTKRALLDLIDTLVLEGGAPFHQTLIDGDILNLLANTRIKKIAKLVREYFGNWKSTMSSDYWPALDEGICLLESHWEERLAGLTQRRGPGSMGQFKVCPINPVIPFYTMLYFRAQRILAMARGFAIFHMLSVHIARQLCT